MTGFEASNSVQPHRNIRHYKLSKKMVRRNVPAIALLFAIIVFLCANHFLLLSSYKEIKYDLSLANSLIFADKQEMQKIVNDNAKLMERYRLLETELDQLEADYSKTSRSGDDLSRQLEILKKQNDELVRQNNVLTEEMKELAKDNIELQNSLKMAASAGVEPQNFSIFEGLENRSNVNRGEYIGKFLGTAYTPSIEECGNNKGITRSGKPIMPGVSIAVDTKYWPFGTVFYIKGLGYAIAMDTGSAIKGKHRFDFAVFDREFALKLGSRKWDVYLVKMGSGRVDDIKL